MRKDLAQSDAGNVVFCFCFCFWFLVSFFFDMIRTENIFLRRIYSTTYAVLHFVRLLLYLWQIAPSFSNARNSFFHEIIFVWVTIVPIDLLDMLDS